MVFVFSLKGSFSILPSVPFHVFILSFFPHKSTTFISFFLNWQVFFSPSNLLTIWFFLFLFPPLWLPSSLGGGTFRGGASPNSIGLLHPFSRCGFLPLPAPLRSLDLSIGQEGVRGVSGGVKPRPGRTSLPSSLKMVSPIVDPLLPFLRVFLGGSVISSKLLEASEF